MRTEEELSRNNTRSLFSAWLIHQMAALFTFPGVFFLNFIECVCLQLQQQQQQHHFGMSPQQYEQGSMYTGGYVTQAPGYYPMMPLGMHPFMVQPVYLPMPVALPHGPDDHSPAQRRHGLYAASGMHRVYSASDARSRPLRPASSTTSLSSVDSLVRVEGKQRQRLDSTTSMQSGSTNMVTTIGGSVGSVASLVEKQPQQTPADETVSLDDQPATMHDKVVVPLIVPLSISATGRASPALSIDSTSSTPLSPLKKRSISTSSLHRCMVCRREGHTPRECPEIPAESLEALLEENGCPVPKDSTLEELATILERFSWLKNLRLHKYANLLLSKPYEWFTSQNEQTLKALGMTSGASKKLRSKVYTDEYFPWLELQEHEHQQPTYGPSPTVGGQDSINTEVSCATSVGCASAEQQVAGPHAQPTSMTSKVVLPLPTRSWVDELSDED